MKPPLQLVFHSSVSSNLLYRPGVPPAFIHDVSFMKAVWLELPHATVCIQHVAGHDYHVWQWNLQLNKPLDCFIEAAEGNVFLIQPILADEATLVIGQQTIHLFPKMYQFLYLPSGIHPFQLKGIAAFFIFIQPPFSLLTGLRTELNGVEELMQSYLKQQPRMIRLQMLPMIEDSWMRFKRLDSASMKKGIPDLVLRKYIIDVLQDFGKQNKTETGSELLFAGTKQKATLLRDFILREPLDDSLDSMEELAVKFYADPRSLNRAFQRLAGKTILQFILQERMKQAQQLVLTTSIPINEIVFRCGFQDVSHFIRSFRKRFGTTPGRMRKNRH